MQKFEQLELLWKEESIETEANNANTTYSKMKKMF